MVYDDKERKIFSLAFSHIALSRIQSHYKSFSVLTSYLCINVYSCIRIGRRNSRHSENHRNHNSFSLMQAVLFLAF